MALSKERRNEIAYRYVVAQVRRRGIPTLKPNEIKREIDNTAKEIGITVLEAREFARDIVSSLVDEAFPKQEHKEAKKKPHLIGEGPGVMSSPML